jgi:hypothetical protein
MGNALEEEPQSPNSRDSALHALDLRVVEQAGQDRLLALVAEAKRLGVVPSAYSTLAIITLMYTLAVTRDTPSDIMHRLTALISQLRELQGGSDNEIRDILLRVQKDEPKLYEALCIYLQRHKRVAQSPWCWDSAALR